ncbi:MAG: proton-conducting transporter membrane subunit, partial [Candidatus Omnitrophica bacterium]|nr:proton-conducting transporter membrane subunit [Candidatus Omnitrophota bacterium]
MNNIILPIIIPLIGAVAAIASLKRLRILLEGSAFLFASLNLILAIMLFKEKFSLNIPWALGLEFSLRLYHFSAFILLCVAGFGFLVTLYSLAFLREKKYANQFYGYLFFTLAFANGAVLADNLILMLFFWEGLLLTLFGMIAIGKKEAFYTATKAFIIVGISDLCLMLGIALTTYLAGTAKISQIHLPLNTLGSIAFVLLMIGAISKAGSMPFHSWIPDAAIDAPLPFMAILPAALEKLLGIYLLTRITLDMFSLTAHSAMSILLMSIGVITIILAVMMALIQKDFKRLLSYHAISQVGYMILGIGTAVPVGIVGGLFHMVNNALYKSCLFLTGGAVEKQTGTTSLEKLGGLGKKMPITFICFLITAAAISGVPPFNGFFSKELIYDGALERGKIFYLAAIIGSFLTAASFLKLGHAAFLGKPNEQNKNTREVPFSMLVPMITIAAICIIFGVFNFLPIKYLIQPILGEGRLEGHNFSG